MNNSNKITSDICKLFLGTPLAGMKFHPYVYNQILYSLFLASNPKPDDLGQLQQLLHGDISCEQLQELYHRENCYTIIDMPTLDAELIHFIDCYGSELKDGGIHFGVYLATFALGNTLQAQFERYLVLPQEVEQRLLLGKYIQQITGCNYLQRKW